MHKVAEKIADCLKAKVEGMGIDNINGQDLMEFELWSKIIKNLVCYDKDKRIIEAMDESEEKEESMKYIEMHEHYPEDERKGYRGQLRDSSGRYMSRRGYESPMMMHDDMRERDYMDGRMYYGGSTGGNTSNMGGSSSGMSSGSSNGSRGYSEGGQMSSRMQRDGREGRSGESRRGYMESKEQGKDKSEKMRELETYMKDLGEDMSEMISGMSPEEKALMKNKLSGLMSKIQ